MNKTVQAVTSPSETGKLPPQALELEEAVLGALLLESKSWEEVENILTEKDFYSRANATIFQAVLNLKQAGNPVDILTVVEELKRMQMLEFIGGPVYIAQLTEKVASAAHIEFHAQIIKQKALSRHLAAFAGNILKMAYDESQDIAEVMEKAEQEFTELNMSTTAGYEAVSMQRAVKMATDFAAQLQQDRNMGIMHNIPTGLERLDNKLFGGWKSPDLVVLGGRPGMGKTQFALLFAQAAGKAEKDCLFISIEMTITQLINRYLLEDEGIDDDRLERGELTPEEWSLVDEKARDLRKLSLHIADHHSISQLKNIKSLARKQHRKGNLKIMIIDYLQLIETGMKFGTRDLEIGYITRSLKNLCKELDIPIILLAQLSRPPKGHKVLPPKLDDLRESGNIEQDADIVILPHRPTYYPVDKDKPLDYDEWINRGVLYIAKHRRGEKDAKVFFKHDQRVKKIFDDDTVSNQFPRKQDEELPF